LDIARKLRNKREKGHRLGRLGSIYYNLGQLERARGLLGGALEIAQDSDDHRYQGYWHHRLGITYRALGQIEDAIDHHKQALRIAPTGAGDPRVRSRNLVELGRVSLYQGDKTAAQAHCQEALALDVTDTAYQATLVLAIISLTHPKTTASEEFADTIHRCQTMPETTPELFEVRYSLATALVGKTVCDRGWFQEAGRIELLSSALDAYQRPLAVCSATGVIKDALYDLELIRSAGIAGLEPVFDLLNSALVQNRARGCALGAAVGDALGMPLEFAPRRPVDQLVRDMEPGRLSAGTFTDDTEMALALADSLLAHRPLDPTDLAQRFAGWLQAGPDDVGNHTRNVLSRFADGQPWAEAVDAVQGQKPDSAGNGSVMRCWPVALAHGDDLDRLLADSALQSRVTHPHPECKAGSAFVNATIYYLLQGTSREDAVAQALDAVDMPAPLRTVIEQAPTRSREALQNSGWVRHTLESAVWGLLTTDTFEDALVQVVNLGNDADTAGAVVGALAGAAYGIDAIPLRWREALQGEWPLRSGTCWSAADLISLADRLVEGWNLGYRQIDEELNE
jgi:ADP-ribosyl-[dinitrogen reductase] hydrolase